MKEAGRAGGNAAIASLGQLAVMAATVATLAYFPFGLALIFLVRIAGVGHETLITFGGNFGIFVGLIAWWLLVFIGALLHELAKAKTNRLFDLRQCGVNSSAFQNSTDKDI